MFGDILGGIGKVFDFKREGDKMKREDAWRREDQARQDSQIQRVVADAKKAGISPLAALGSPAAGQFGSPVGSTSTGSAYGDALGSFGRAADKAMGKRHVKEMQSLEKQRLQNENDLVKANIRNLDAQTMEARSRSMIPTQAAAAQANANGQVIWQTYVDDQGRTVQVPVGPDVGEIVAGGAIGAAIAGKELLTPPKVSPSRQSQIRSRRNATKRVPQPAPPVPRRGKRGDRMRYR